jgi:hypothetical protein
MERHKDALAHCLSAPKQERRQLVCLKKSPSAPACGGFYDLSAAIDMGESLPCESVPPVIPTRAVGPNWCHPSFECVRESVPPVIPTRVRESVPPVIPTRAASPNWCHPSFE